LTEISQVLRNQTELDTNIKELANSMVKLFSLVKETQPLTEKIELFNKTLELMAEQTIECAVFIKDYASRGFLGKWKAFLHGICLFRF
jgi:hypothetical protein